MSMKTASYLWMCIYRFHTLLDIRVSLGCKFIDLIVLISCSMIEGLF